MKHFTPYFILVAFLVSFQFLNAQNMNYEFSGISVGNPVKDGSTSYSREEQTYTLKGAGENIWFENDQFWFECTKITGDFILSATINFVGKGVNAHRKIGLMARSNTQANSAYVDVCVHGDGLTGMQFREKTGENTAEFKSNITAPEYVQIERKGDTYIVRVSKDNQPMVTVAEKKFDLGKEILAGMFVCSHDADVIETANFCNVRIEVPAGEEVDGYQTQSASRLEILDVETGLRKVIYETDEHIEAPNWSRDGKFLIYNSTGRLYKFDLEEMQPEEINTGFAQSNNNDHGISFDGKTLAISNFVEEDGGGNSIIFTVPIEGGKEIRLTSAEGLDDGPEYSPDGEYIYFNSTRTGTMQIWRMKPDGSNQEQVTFDNYQNWFAHPSPDGKQLIMISYPPTVPAGSHPHNKRVMLRTMPVNGSEIKVAAFLYGGQGTINVPSWSPDSKKVAFVSFTY